MKPDIRWASSFEVRRAAITALLEADPERGLTFRGLTAGVTSRIKPGHVLFDDMESIIESLFSWGFIAESQRDNRRLVLGKYWRIYLPPYTPAQAAIQSLYS